MSTVEWTDADLACSIYADEEVQQAIAKVVNEVPEALVSRACIADLALRTVAPFVAAREAQAVEHMRENREAAIEGGMAAVAAVATERDALRATVARVEALVDEWEERCEHYRGTGNFRAQRSATDELRAALGES